jgi:hypothetical protein
MMKLKKKRALKGKKKANCVNLINLSQSSKVVTREILDSSSITRLKFSINLMLWWNCKFFCQSEKNWEKNNNQGSDHTRKIK